MNNFYKNLIFKKKIFLFLISIFILALIFRVRSTLAHDVWLDEASVYTLATGFDTYHLSLMKHWDVAHPPLLYILMHWFIVLNDYRFIPIQLLRIPFVILSALAVFSLFYLAKKLLRSPTIALIICLWYAVHPFQILLGYSVRPYALLQFLFPIACFAFFEEYWKSKKQVLFWNGMFIFLFYWDYAFLWFASVYLIHLGIKYLSHSISFKNKFLQIIPFIFCTAIWLPIFISRLNDLFYLTVYSHIFSLKNALFLFSGFNTSNALILENNLYLLIVIIILAICCILFILKNKRVNFILLGVFFPIIIAYTISIFHPIFIPQNYLLSSILLLFIYSSPLQYKKIAVGYGVLVCFFLIYQEESNKSFFKPLLSIKQLNAFNDNGQATFFYFGSLDYDIRYQFLRNNYKLLLNSQGEYEKDDRKLTLYTIDLARPEAYGLPRSFPQFEQGNRYLITESNTSFNPDQKHIISQYCNLTEVDFLSLQNNDEASYLPCR